VEEERDKGEEALMETDYFLKMKENPMGNSSKTDSV
jgi:hypothetical protein